MTVGQQVPIRQSTLEKLADYIAQPENEWLAVATELRARAFVAPSNVITTGIWEDIQNAFIHAFVDGMTPEEALKQAMDDFCARNINR